MITLTPKKVETNNIIIKIDQTKVARGHSFVAAIRRGGKFVTRKSRRNAKQKFNKEISV